MDPGTRNQETLTAPTWWVPPPFQAEVRADPRRRSLWHLFGTVVGGFLLFLAVVFFLLCIQAGNATPAAGETGTGKGNVNQCLVTCSKP